MLRSATATKATCVAEKDKLMKKTRPAFLTATLFRWPRKQFALARPKKSAWLTINQQRYRTGLFLVSSSNVVTGPYSESEFIK